MSIVSFGSKKLLSTSVKIHREAVIIMGNYINTYVDRDTETEKEKTQAQCTPTDEIAVDVNFHTPVAQKTLSIDPRSVTSGIYRTPIDVYSTPVGVNNKVLSAIPMHLQCKPYLETDLNQLVCLSPKKAAPKIVDEELDLLNVEFTNTEMQLTPTVDSSMTKRAFTPIDEERYNVLGIDPQSAAADFDRAPMLTPKSMILLKARKRESLLRRGSYDTDVLCSKIFYCETSTQFNIPKIQALYDLAMVKVRSSNLLKNKIDRLNELDSSSNHLSETEANSEDKQAESGSGDESKTTLDSCNDIEKDTKQKEVHAISSDTIKIQRDSLILDDPTELNSTELQCDIHVEEKISQFPKHEAMTFYDDRVAKDTLSMKLSRCEINKSRADINKNERIITKSKAKISADEKQIFTCNDKTGTKSTKIQTPLDNRSNNGHIQTILATNSPQQVIRNRNIKLKVSQEKLSPHKYVAKRNNTKSIEWDPNSTVII